MRRTLRVLVIEPAGLLWGSERALLDLLAAIDRERINVTVACPPGTPICAELDARAVRWVPAPIARLHRHGRIARVRALFALWRIIARERPDVIHVNQSGMTKMVVVAARRRAPVVSHVRLFDDAALMRRVHGTRVAPQAMIAISKSILAAMGDAAQSASTCRLIYDPFDAEGFRANAGRTDRAATRRSLGIPEDSRVAVHVGRVCREKGQHLLIEALTHEGARDTIALIVGGVPPADDDSSRYAQEIRTYAAVHGIVDRVRFLGERPDIAALVQAADVLVLSSQREPFGRVLLEALALGVPVVASNTGGAEEIIGEGLRGIGFPPGDAGALASALRATFADAASTAERQENGRRFVDDVCSPARHARAVEELIADLAVAQPRNVRPSRS